MSNKEYKINYLSIAKKDLNEIIEYIQADDSNAALELQFVSRVNRVKF